MSVDIDLWTRDEVGRGLGGAGLDPETGAPTSWAE
jgi:hypothetical protein